MPRCAVWTRLHVGVCLAGGWLIILIGLGFGNVTNV